MKFCISFGKFELKFFFYCVFIVITKFFLYYVTCYEKENINDEHCLMDEFCFFLGYLLNFIPAWISHIKSKEKEKPIINKLKEENKKSIEYIYNKPYESYLSIKDIIKFLFICLILIIAEMIENTGLKIDKKEENINDNKKDYKYGDDYNFIEYIIIFLVSILFKEVYYKHQFISFFILILVQVIKIIYFAIKKSNDFHIFSFFLNIIYSILYAIYFLYIKNVMKIKFISPYKCNFMIGIIDVPIVIIIYFIISLTPLGNDKSEYYYDNIFKLFEDLGKIKTKGLIKLISLPIAYGIYQFIVIKTIYDYSIFHMYIPFSIEIFIENIIDNFEMKEKTILIISNLIEIIMILIFIEIIEINCCGLNKNLKKNIQTRGTIDSSLNIENDDDNDNDSDDDINDEGNDERSKIKN